MPAIANASAEQPNAGGADLSEVPSVVIVGSGLAGCSAALQLRESLAGRGCAKVLMLEKEARPGGNSQKASSGISIFSPEHGDTEEQFIQDCLSSGRGLSAPALVEALVVSESRTHIVYPLPAFTHGRCIARLTTAAVY